MGGVISSIKKYEEVINKGCDQLHVLATYLKQPTRTKEELDVKLSTIDDAIKWLQAARRGYLFFKNTVD